MNRSLDEQGNLVLEFTLPCIPPSVNHYYGNRAMGKRVIRYITAKGKAFKEIVKKTVKVESLLKGRLIMFVTYAYTDRRKHDLDNNTKALWDSLNQVLYEDDGDIVALGLHKTMSNTGFPYTHVKIIQPKM